MTVADFAFALRREPLKFCDVLLFEVEVTFLGSTLFPVNRKYNYLYGKIVPLLFFTKRTEGSDYSCYNENK